MDRLTAGQMDRRITIRRATTATNDFGEAVPTWCDLVTVWASKEDIRDSERFQAQEVGADRTTRFRIRYSQAVADVTPKDTIVYDGRTYNIVATKELGRRVGIEITASARAD